MPEHFKRISAEEFADLDCDEVTLLDLREEYEFERDGIEGSINLPMDQIGTRLSEVPKDKPVSGPRRSPKSWPTGATTPRRSKKDSIHISH